MRNILEYPVTYEEKVQMLEELIKEANDLTVKLGICGDMRGLILEEILNDVKRLNGT